MLGKREYAVVAALLAAAVLLTGRIRVRLDGIVAPFRDEFQSMMYLPRGDTLKIMAAGFDAPAADALFIKALVYYPQAARQTRFKDESKLYVHELFDVVTDLSPRFYRAYQVGGLFLTASASLEANMQGLKLLRKGVAVYDEIEAENVREGREPERSDPRWLFHSLIATTLDVNIQSRLRDAGDMKGAAEARIEAGGHFRLAASSPGAPEYIVAAARGFESVLRGRGDIEAARAAVLSVWTEMCNQAVERGDGRLAADLEQRIGAAKAELDAIVVTRGLQVFLSRAGERYLKEKGRAAASVEELHRAGMIAAAPAVWPLDAPAKERDQMLALPDGGFRSRVLARWETREHLDLLLDSVILYRRFNGGPPPPSLEALVEDGILAALPVPPLAGLGQKYEYDPLTGMTGSTHGELLEQPPVSPPQEERPRSERLGDIPLMYTELEE